ncbi:MAG: hypothetical protein ACREYE_01115 [Gammaproteobacteria bacterium]
MSETIAITGKSVKLFKGHYTRSLSGFKINLLRRWEIGPFSDHSLRLRRSGQVR